MLWKSSCRVGISACALLTVISTCLAGEPASHPATQRADSPGGVHLQFSADKGPAVLTSLQSTGGPQWAGTAAASSSLWRLSLHGPGAVKKELASADVPLADIRTAGLKTTLTWTTSLGDQPAQVTLVVECEAGSTLSTWQLAAELPAGWTVTRADWPILPNIQTEPGTKMAAPFGWGLEYDVTPGMSYSGIYPSLVANMPFVAFYHGGHGLYVGYHDEQGHHKNLAVKTGPQGTAVTLTHWPAEADTAKGHYAPKFRAVVGTFRGDYWDAAQIYRAFTFKTRWGRDPLRLASTTQPVPTWLRDIDLWLIPGADPLTNVDACRRAAEFFDVPIALHWYKWHEIPYDTLYPDYFPPKPHFHEGVKALQAAGLRVMPYINGRLCDPNSKTWTQEGGDRLAARDEKGQPYTEVYGSKVPLHAMCPATRQWQDKIAGIVNRLVTDYGVDGVYIDQIGAAYAVRCFSQDHGHSPGGGTFWVDSYREMLARIRASLPAHVALTTEENAECWNDQFDAQLIVNTPSGNGRHIIPLAPTVYAGRIIAFGFQYMHGDDVPRSLPFRAKMARAFLWGSQLGWISVDSIMAAGAHQEAEFLRNLAQARHGAHDFLLTGQFLGEVEVTGDNPRLTGEGTGNAKYAIDLPAVMATAWLARDNRIALAVVNLSDTTREVALHPEWARIERIFAATSPERERAAGGRASCPPGVQHARLPRAVATTSPERGAAVRPPIDPERPPIISLTIPARAARVIPLPQTSQLQQGGALFQGALSCSRVVRFFGELSGGAGIFPPGVQHAHLPRSLATTHPEALRGRPRHY